MILNDVPISSGEWPIKIYTSQLQGNFTAYDTSGEDITAKLRERGVLCYLVVRDHGYLKNTAALGKYIIQRSYIAMSSEFQEWETPLFFARVENSLTGTTLTQADISFITMTIYQYSFNGSIRAAKERNPVDGYSAVPVPVSEVIFDEPVTDPRCSFEANFRHEIDTVGDNPFDTAGTYDVVYKLMPVSGNVIPITFNITVR